MKYYFYSYVERRYGDNILIGCGSGVVSKPDDFSAGEVHTEIMIELSGAGRGNIHITQFNKVD